MKAPSIYIVEDEPLIVTTIETALRKQGYSVIGDAEDVSSAMKDIGTLKPNLVLIDIQLEGSKDGVDLAQELDKLNQPYLFLTSQTDPDTISRVKETKPLGYIVKPFTEHSLRSNIEIAWHNYSISNNTFLMIRSEGRLHKVNQKSILYLKAFDNYCYVVTAAKTYLVPHTLKHVSEQLDKSNFVRSHRSYWVNLQHIQSVEKNTIQVGDDHIQLSSAQRSLLISKLKS